MAQSVTILGSTGSIGQSAVRVLASMKDRYTVDSLVCSSSIETLEQQVQQLKPRVVAVGSEEAWDLPEFVSMREQFPGTTFLSGEEGVLEAASRPVDICLSAIVGFAGLKPTVKALEHGGRIALANKETLVAAGSLVMDLARKNGAEIIPVDSEHSAIFMLMQNKRPEDIERIILTASGGSLRSVPVYDLDIVSPESALQHPTWEMGRKITIDSATLMNKGLEVIEAHHLFGVSYDFIDVAIHPQSIVHSMVETVDGAMYAHMGLADMAFPIANAFTWPEVSRNEFGRLSLADMPPLDFQDVDIERYPALELCYRAGREEGTMPAVLNAANEEAVYAFLDKKIKYTAMTKIVAKVMESHSCITEPGLDDIYKVHSWASEKARELISGENL